MSTVTVRLNCLAFVGICGQWAMGILLYTLRHKPSISQIIIGRKWLSENIHLEALYKLADFLVQFWLFVLNPHIITCSCRWFRKD